MKTVLLFNFDVGSGVEYCGNIFKNWIEEFDNIKFINYTEQDHAGYVIKKIKDIKPDVIIINDLMERSVICSYYYKVFNPDTKIILLLHSWKALSGNTDCTDDPNEKNQIILNTLLYDYCDKIFLMNYMPPYVRIPHGDDMKITNAYFPVDDSYCIKTKWENRKNRFIYLGALCSPKFSEKFIDLLHGTKIKIDCYGYNKFSLLKKINDCPNLIYKGIIPQNNVADILNEYKYLVIPHDGYELFNISILQSILCGTIPLISNDRTNNSFDHNWIDWANGLHYECNTEEDLIKNLTEILYIDMDCAEESENISKIARERFSYDRLKEKFKNTLSRWL